MTRMSHCFNFRNFRFGCSVLMATAAVVLAAEDPAAPKPIQIGVEYVMPGMASALAELGVPVAKPYPDAIAWGKMQPTKDSPIDFAKLDRVVRECQQAGFKELVIALKSASPWAARNVLKNPTPKPEYLPLYEAWVRAVVERYDGDGREDMPGLKYPVRFFEIGTEFSSYEPEPVADYLVMLEHAYRAAHAASPTVTVLHAAFLTTTVFRDHPTPDQYAEAFRNAPRRIVAHDLGDIRAVLDRADLFDAVNLHALGDPLEIEEMMVWLRSEMVRRKIAKPVVISDTTPSPLIAWGPATRVSGPASSLGITVPPAGESDRPRLAEFFNRLIDGSPTSLKWAHEFVAADMVKKVVVAAEQQVSLINTSLAEDLVLLKSKPLQAGAGLSAWAGMTDVTINPQTDERTVTGRRPLFYAIQQLQRHIQGYDSVNRFQAEGLPIRVYEFHRGLLTVRVAWFEPPVLFLPSNPIPHVVLTLPTKLEKVVVEKMIADDGQTAPVRETVVAVDGKVRIDLSSQPVYIQETP